MTREQEFSDSDLGRLLALGHYEAGECACGIHESLTADRNNVFTFDKRTCPVCKGWAQYSRVMADEDRAAEEHLKDSPASTPRPGDGRRMYIRQLSAPEVEARRNSSGPAVH